MTKPYTKKNSKTQSDNTETQKKNFGYAMIADRLRIVSWINVSHPTDKVKPINGIPTFPLTTNTV